MPGVRAANDDELDRDRCSACDPARCDVSRPAVSPALLYVSPATGTQVRFRVVTPDHHPVAVTIQPALAAATALAVARHHPARYAAIAASDGRWLEVHVDGHTTLTPSTSERGGWPATVERALGRLAPARPMRSRSHPMTDTLEHVIDIELDRLAAHPRNVRRSPGDLKDLIRSIRDRGIETPLVVLPADGAGVHHIVAGHRRRAAAETVGLASVPCIVRDFEDEADVVLCMIAENTQRSDGLNIVDEAQALAAVIDLRGGTVSTRKLATAVGHSEGWVRSRLALLSLPDSALDALHAGTITIDVATALTAVAEHPDLVDQLVTQRGLTRVAGRVRPSQPARRPRRHRRQQRPHRSRGVGRQRGRLERQPVDVEDPRRPPRRRHGPPQRAVPRRGRQVPLRRHRGRDPGVHRAGPPPRPQPRQRARRHDHPAVRDRAGRHGRASGTTPSRRRPHRLGQRTTPQRTPDRRRRRLPAGHRHMDRQRPYTAVQRAVKLLGIDHPDEGYVDYTAVLQRHLDAEPKRLATVAVALAAAIAEERARQSFGSTTVARYLDAIERLGYQPTDWEHTQRLTTAA